MYTYTQNMAFVHAHNVLASIHYMHSIETKNITCVVYNQLKPPKRHTIEAQNAMCVHERYTQCYNAI